MRTSLLTSVTFVLAAMSAATANAGVFSAAAVQMGAIDNPGTIPIGIPARQRGQRPDHVFR